MAWKGKAAAFVETAAVETSDGRAKTLLWEIVRSAVATEVTPTTKSYPNYGRQNPDIQSRRKNERVRPAFCDSVIKVTTRIQWQVATGAAPSVVIEDLEGLRARDFESVEARLGSSWFIKSFEKWKHQNQYTLNLGCGWVCGRDSLFLQKSKIQTNWF